MTASLPGLTAGEPPRDWYVRERPTYERLVESVVSALRSLLNDAKVDYLSISGRAKEVDSFAEKIGRKGYRDPQKDMTDMAGIRVVTFVESDVARISELIEKAFNVDKSRSLDKKTELARDQFGYRSVHFVCDLGPDRLKLLENAAFSGRVFEIQVRTVLQHAWAEIHHDRGYKLGGTLPSELERQLYGVSATLEMVDREFDRITRELDTYASEVKKKTSEGDLNVEINTASLLSYLPTVVAPRLKSTEVRELGDPDRYNDLIAELRELGLNTLADLDAYFTRDFLAAEGSEREVTDIGLVRSAIMFADLDGYFTKVKPRWSACDYDSWQMLSKKYGKDYVLGTLREAGVTILNPSGEAYEDEDEDDLTEPA